MGGKSTFLRQTALIALMAQMGSFVPAREAKVGLRRPHLHARGRHRPHPARPVHVHGRDAGDRPHPAPRHAHAAWCCSTRSAAAPPPSTASRSPGRWRSTSRATAAAAPKTLFATHYHELTDLAADLPGVGNLHVSAREWKDGVVFLRKIEPGGSDRSFGIQVARLAGLPAPVVVRAQEILRNLERTEFDREGRPRLAHSEEPAPTPGAAARALLRRGRGGAGGAAAARRRRPDAAAGAGAAGRAQEAPVLAWLDPPRHAPYTPGRKAVVAEALLPARRRDEACA